MMVELRFPSRVTRLQLDQQRTATQRLPPEQSYDQPHPKPPTHNDQLGDRPGGHAIPRGGPRLAVSASGNQLALAYCSYDDLKFAKLNPDRSWDVSIVDLTKNANCDLKYHLETP